VMPWSLISTSRPLANTESRGFRLGAPKAMVGYPSPNEVDYSTFSRVPQKRNCRSTALPRISCRISWVGRASCGFLCGKPHTRTCLRQRGRKSGYASVGMIKVRLVANTKRRAHDKPQGPDPTSDLSSRAYPDFLLRGTKDDLVCGFHQGKPHELRGTHRT
jgi:hypothetical protein